MSRFPLILVAAFASAVLGSDVLDLTDSTFNDKVAEHDFMLVEFYAPWCGHCKRLAPEYERAATALKKNDPPVPLAKVDCIDGGKDVCSANGVSGYPTLKIFKHGKFFADYDGPREANGIVNYLKGKVGPAAVEATTVEAFEAKLAKNQVIIAAFFSSEDKIEEFKKAADKIRESALCVYSSSAEVMKKYGHKDTVVLFRPRVMKNKFEDIEVEYDGELTGSALLTFATDNFFGMCGHRTQDNAAKFPNDKPLVLVYYDVDYELNAKGTNYWRNRVMKVAQNYVKELRFAVCSAKDFSYEKEEMGLKDGSDVPQVGVRDTANKKFPMTEKFSMDTFEAFLKDYTGGKLVPYLKSEAVPESNDGPVKIAVASNFDEVITNADKDVLVEFYAPWCGHCKKLAPILEELGEKLSGEEVSIVKMDATANDVPSHFEVSGFPTLYWIPKDKNISPKRYEGGREVDDFLSYVAKEATNPLKKYSRTGKEKSTEL